MLLYGLGLTIPGQVGYDGKPGRTWIVGACAVASPSIRVGIQAKGHCVVCGEAQPMVSYTYPDGRVIRMHSACDNVWHEERERP